jgi:hypothetical protein
MRVFFCVIAIVAIIKGKTNWRDWNEIQSGYIDDTLYIIVIRFRLDGRSSTFSRAKKVYDFELFFSNGKSPPPFPPRSARASQDVAPMDNYCESITMLIVVAKHISEIRNSKRPKTASEQSSVDI